MPDTDLSDDYGAEPIRVLTGLEAVRKRPGMYIGDTEDGSGLHNMIFYLVENAVDEVMACSLPLVAVTLHDDGSCTVTDNGRGIPTDILRDAGVSGAEVVLTQLYAGTKFEDATVRFFGGLHGVGVSVVNALAAKLELRIWRASNEFRVEFREGDPVAPLAVVGPAGDRRGTSITFLPSSKIFAMTNFDCDVLERHLRDRAFLNPGLRIVLSDERCGVEMRQELSYNGGIKDFARYLTRSWRIIEGLEAPILLAGERDDIRVECAFLWNEAFVETIRVYTNNIHQSNGGTHLSGFRSAITDCLKENAGVHNIYKQKRISLIGDEIWRGITVVVSVQMASPKFSSQTKDKLVSSEIRPIIKTIIFEEFSQWLQDHPREAQAIHCKLCLNASTRGKAASKVNFRTTR